MSNGDTNIHDISGQVAFAQVGGNMVGDIVAGNKTIIQNFYQQAAKQIITAPYKFLASYDISDRDIFFGRDAVIEELAGKLPRYKTLVINGRSGSGKTSLINAGLIPRLAENGYQYLSFRDYHDPLQQLGEYVRQNPAFQPYAEYAHSLPVLLHALIQKQQMPVVVIFDQFERFFLNVPTALRQQFIQEIKACVESALTGHDIDLIFAEREEYFGQLTREFNAVIPAFLKETEILDLPPLGRAEAQAAILQPLERVSVKIGYDLDFVEEVLLPGLMGESSGGLMIDPPHLQIVCNQLYEQAKVRCAAKLERGGVAAIDRALYDDLHGATGILNSYLDDCLAKIAPQIPGGQAVLRSLLKTMVATTSTRKFVALPDVQRGLADVVPTTVADGLRLLREERIIEMRGQDEATTYSLSHEVMVEKVQSWFDERELQRKKAQETLERGLAEWASSQALLNENQVKQIRQWAQPDDVTTQAEELLTTSQHAYEAQQRKEAEQERRIRLGKRILWGVIGLALIVAIGLTNWALRERGTALTQKGEAEKQTQLAQKNEAEANRRAMVSLSQTFSFQALDQITRHNGTRAALLARQAYLFHQQYHGQLLPQMDNALRQTLEALHFQSSVLMHPGGVWSVAFSPNGKYLASGSLDKTVQIWDLTRPDMAPRILSGHEKAVYSVAFSPDGLHLASGSIDRTVRIWDLTQPDAVPRVLLGHEDQVSCVAYSPDGNFLASGSTDKTIRLWNMHQSEATPHIIGKHDKEVTAIAFSPNGKLLASASEDQLVQVWGLTQIGAAPRLFAYEGMAYSVAFSPDGKLLAVNNDGIIQIWNLIQPEVAPRILAGHEEVVTSLVFSPDGKLLASGSDDRTVRIWDLRQPDTLPRILVGHEVSVLSVAFSPDGTHLASGSTDQTVRLWNLASPVIAPQVLTGHEGVVVSVAFSPDGVHLASSSKDDEMVWLWDVTQPTAKPRLLAGHEEGVTSVVFSPNGNYLASGSFDRTVRVWDVSNTQNTGQSQATTALRVLTGHKAMVVSVAFSPDSTHIASGSDDQTIRIWDLTEPTAEPRILVGHEKGVWAVAFSPDGTHLASGSQDKTVRVWNLTSPTPKAEILGKHEKWVFSVAFSPDGTHLASGSLDYTVRLWDLTQPTIAPRVLSGHGDMVRSVAFSPDGKRLASGSTDRTVRLWDMTQPTAAPLILPHKSAVWSVAFSPDGKYLASGNSEDKSVWIWKVNLDDLAALICEQAGRNLTWEEWQQFIGSDIPYERTCPDLPEHPSVSEHKQR